MSAVWNALTFILNGLVFITIGLQLPYVLGQIRGLERTQLFIYGVLFSAFLIFLRLAWTFPGAALGYLIRRRFLHQNEPWPSGRPIFVVGWTGMRGVIALAAAISLPQTLGNGNPFSQRSLIIFLTFSVILVTLVLQGLTLPMVIRELGIGDEAGAAGDTDEARRLVIQAALDHLAEIKDTSPEFSEIDADIASHYQHRLASLHSAQDETDRQRSQKHSRYLDVSRELLNFQRDTALQLRREGRISNEALRQIERDLDLSVIRLNSARATPN